MTTKVTAVRDSLRADCTSCIGLCCVALPLTRSADFAIDKAAGMPCPHLTTSDRCEIHSELRERGFPGCSAFDCFGAGQQVTQVTYRGVSWRDDAPLAEGMFRAFVVLRAVHEMRWYLADASERAGDSVLKEEVTATAHRLQQVSTAPLAALDALDVNALRGEIGELLRRVSAAVCAGPDFAGRDLVGQNLSGANLRGALLRGALLIGADLRGADLSDADLLGTDLRGANLCGADLSGALFLTSPQLSAALGDGATRIPAWLPRPKHWRVDGASPESA